MTESTKGPARRGRPRAFDRDEALRRAMEAFRAHGYDGTSMTQLVDAMGIASPSIYAAFGSKDALFSEAVDLYVASEVAPSWDALERIDDAGEAVRAMLFASIDVFAARAAPRGCLVVLGAGHLGGEDGAARAILRDRRHLFRERLLARLSRDDAGKGPAADRDPGALADCVMAFFGGLAIQAADGGGRHRLREAAALFCDGLFPRR